MADERSALEPSLLDRAIAALSPQRGLKRQRARIAAVMLADQARHYEGAAIGRRTQGWKRPATDANSAAGPSLSKLRDAARDLERNNAFAESAVSTIVDHAISWGIVATAKHQAWLAHTESTAIDADGRNNLLGLEKLAKRTVVVSGEVIVRRRWRRLEDGLPLPFQVQVLEPDYIDTGKDGRLSNGNYCIQGVEFDLLGRRAAYWLFKEHPGASLFRSGASAFGQSQRVPASEILHVFKQSRPGQVRGPSWFAPVLLTSKDYDDLKDAKLMQQKVASCLAVITSDVDGTGVGLGTTSTSTKKNEPFIDTLSPGAIINAPPGRNIQVVNPPSVSEYPEYSKTVLREIATGLGVSYEDLTGDYTGMPFSAARMSRLRHWARVQDWRWRVIVPQFLNPLWGWAMEAAELAGLPVVPKTDWTAPALPMIDVDKEALAIMRQIRSGLTTFSEAIRERGYEPTAFMDELKRDFEKLKELGLVLDSDPRVMTQAGQAQGSAAAKPQSTTEKSAGDEEADDDRVLEILHAIGPDRAAYLMKQLYGGR